MPQREPERQAALRKGERCSFLLSLNHCGFVIEEKLFIVLARCIEGSHSIHYRIKRLRDLYVLKKHREKGDGSAECMSITLVTETESERKVVAGFSHFYLFNSTAIDQRGE